MIYGDFMLSGTLIPDFRINMKNAVLRGRVLIDDSVIGVLSVELERLYKGNVNTLRYNQYL